MQATASRQSRPIPDVALALERGAGHLFSLQADEGYWWAELESNVTMASEHLLLEQFLGIGEPARWQKLARYLLNHQLADGSWPVYFGGPGDVSVSSEAYFALKLAGVTADSPELTKARDFILAHGGIGKTRVFTKLWLSLFGEFEWEAMPAMPPEAILFPPWFPFNIYSFASWARATIVPILVVWAYRPLVPIPAGAGVSELFADPADRQRIRFARDRRPVTWRNVFLGLDRVAKTLERMPWRPLRSRALADCERWIAEHQEADGSWGGIQPPWVYSMIALKCRGYGMDHPVMARALDGLLHSFALEDEETFTMQPCLSPVWDTALAVTGLREAGVPADDPRLLRAAEWMLSKEVRRKGDWAVNVRNAAPGGWSFEFANEIYPDTDDTAEVLIALRLLKLDRDADGPRQRATQWLRTMQSRSGGWGSFDRDNTREFVSRIAFADFGATIDPPTEDVSAHVLEWLLLDGFAPEDPVVAQGLRYLRNTQEADGSWWGRWGVNYVYGTGAALPALAAAGARPQSERFRRAARWLAEHQNGDGGWGESCRSYYDASTRGQGVSTASQTAWALLALLAAGQQESEAVERGVAYLVRTQSENGEWPEAEFTGTGFPRDFMLKYHYYRLSWPLWALGRYRRLIEGTPIHLPGTDPWR